MIKKSVQIFRGFGYRVLPGTCILCHAASKRHLDLCLECEQDLPTLGTHCQQCALPLETAGNNFLCGQCLQQPPVFDRLVALFPYQFPVVRLINDLKFHDRLVNAKVLGNLLAERLRNHYLPSPYPPPLCPWVQTVDLESKPSMIIPVPLHRSRLKERGYNQALELARPISQQLNIPINYKLCQRLRDTQHQTAMSAEERHKNLRGAFFALTPVPKHVAIVDDVVTTTATVNALASCLRTAGAETIDVWCVVRTILK